MKKFTITAGKEVYKMQGKDISCAIKFKNNNLCKFKHWIIREIR